MADVTRRLVAAGAAGLLVPASAREAPLAACLRYERDTGGRAGVFAQNLKTHATLSARADERFVMCSTFKASLAALVLSRVSRGEETLSRRIRFSAADLQPYAPEARRRLSAGELSVEELCRAAVELSDNTCANLLLGTVGGPPALTRFWRSLGDGVSRLDHDEPLLNRSPPGDPHDTTSPRAMAVTLRRLLLEGALPASAADRLEGWMRACATGKDRLRAGLPNAWTIGDKTGSNGADAAGDIALCRTPAGAPVVIAVYVQGGRSRPDQIRSLFAGVGDLVGARLA